MLKSHLSLSLHEGCHLQISVSTKIAPTTLPVIIKVLLLWLVGFTHLSSVQTCSKIPRGIAWSVSGLSWSYWLIDESVRLCVLTDIDKRGFDQRHALSHNLFSWEFVIGRQSLHIENESGERKRAKEQMAVMKWYYWKKKCGRIRHLI